VHHVRYVTPDITYQLLFNDDILPALQMVLYADVTATRPVYSSLSLKTLYTFVRVVSARTCLEWSPIRLKFNMGG